MIAMYLNDHPPPHFHIRKNTQEQMRVTVEDLRVMDGSLPAALRNDALGWAAEHHDYLRAAWEHAERGDSIPSVEQWVASLGDEAASDG